MVERFLAAPGGQHAFERFRAEYLKLIERRHAAQRASFDALAELARGGDVYLGCNCPTERQPLVERCHTWLALGFMRDAYPELAVVFPDP